MSVRWFILTAAFFFFGTFEVVLFLTWPHHPAPPYGAVVAASRVIRLATRGDPW